MDSNGFRNIALRMGNVLTLLDGGNRLRDRKHLYNTPRVVSFK